MDQTQPHESPSAPEGTSRQDPASREALAFAASFRRFLDWVHSSAAGADHGNEVSELVRGYLGAAGAQHSVVTRDMPAFEHVNLQTAISAWLARPGRTAEIRGIAVPPHYGGLTLQQLVGGDGLPPVRLTAPALADLPNGPGSTLGCLRMALLLVCDAGRMARPAAAISCWSRDRASSILTLRSRLRACPWKRRRACWPSWTGCGPS